MATILFLVNAACPLGGAGQKQMSPVRGTGSLQTVTNATAGGTNIPVTLTGGGTAVSWWYQVKAITISGNVSANIRGLESATTVNVGAGILIERYDPTGTTLLGTILSDRTVPSTITEYTTADAAKALAAVAPTSTTMNDGDWIKVTLKGRNVGVMAAGSFRNSYNGPTAGAAGDTSVTFTETLVPYVPALDAIGPSSAGGGTTVSPATWTHVCGGSATLLLVAVNYGKSPDTGVTLSATYNGVSMTAIGSPLHSGTDTAGYIQWFKLQNPTAGSNAVSVTATGSSGTFSLIGGSISFNSPVTDVGTLTTNANTTGTPNANPTLTVSGHAGFPAVAAIVAGQTVNRQDQISEIILNLNSTTAAGNFAMAVASGMTSTVFGGTLGGADEWGMAGFELIAAAGGALLAVAQKGAVTRALGMKSAVTVNAYSK